MSKDVKSLPGEGIGWRWEGEAGGSTWPSCPSAEFLLHLGRLTLRTSGAHLCNEDELPSGNMQKRLEENFL